MEGGESIFHSAEAPPNNYPQDLLSKRSFLTRSGLLPDFLNLGVESPSFPGATFGASLAVGTF